MRRLLLIVLCLCLSFAATATVGAQSSDSPKIQEFIGQVTPDNSVAFFDLFKMRAGSTIYVYSESNQIDTLVAICDISCEEIFADNDDISGSNFNSALQFTFPDDGDYSIALGDCCDEQAQGTYRLLIGFNAPNVLTGDAEPNGARLAQPYADTFIPANDLSGGGEAVVQEFNDAIDAEFGFTYFDIFDATAGETLYAYAESNQIDTYLVVCDIECTEILAENDDISGSNLNSALSYTFPADGDYSVAVADCCDETAAGAFRLLLGYNAPDILTGNAVPNSTEVAVRYNPTGETPVLITGDRQVQEFYSQVSEENEFVYFDLFGMQAGTTIYLYAESDDIDTLLFLCDLDCEVEFSKNDDISANNLNSALEFTFAEDGDYSIAVTDCCLSDVEGIFRLLIGFNAPDVLDGTAIPNEARIAVPWEPSYTPISVESTGGSAQVQQFSGSVSPDADLVYYDIFGGTGRSDAVFVPGVEHD